MTLRYWYIPLLCFHEKRLYAGCVLAASLRKQPWLLKNRNGVGANQFPARVSPAGVRGISRRTVTPTTSKPQMFATLLRSVVERCMGSGVAVVPVIAATNLTRRAKSHRH